MADQETEPPLRRDVGWFGSFSMGYADVGADIYVAVGLVALYAAGASPLAFLIASVSYICTGLAYAELATIYPYAGGAHVYAMKAFNDLTGFVAGWAVMLDYTLDIALFALATAGYLSFFIPGLNIGYAAVIFIAGLIFINLIGIKYSSALNSIFVSLDLLVEATILVTGFYWAFHLNMFLNQLPIVGTPNTLLGVLYYRGFSISSQNFIYGITIAMSSFIGIESIAQAAEETKNPSRWIPRASKLSIVSVIFIALAIIVLSMGILPYSTFSPGSTAVNDPIAVIAKSIPYVGVILAPIVAFTGLSICLVSTNTGVIGVSRIVYSMGRYDLLPKWFYKTHKKFRTPYRTILLFGIIGALLASFGELTLVASLYNFGALLSYILVNASLIVLRNKEPDTYRAWKVKGDISLRGGKLKIPIISAIGVLITSILWSFIIIYHPDGRLLGTVWVFVGLILFYFFRQRIKISTLAKYSGSKILPGAYTLNATVLVDVLQVDVPDENEVVAASIIKSLDKRLKIDLLSVVDARAMGLRLEQVGAYEQLRELESESKNELVAICKRLKRRGYECVERVRVGAFSEVIRDEAEKGASDVFAVIRRKGLKGDVDRQSVIEQVFSQYPGKLMVIRRQE
jgi:basic amino acid/polyamine antiporter, APA family